MEQPDRRHETRTLYLFMLCWLIINALQAFFLAWKGMKPITGIYLNT